MGPIVTLALKDVKLVMRDKFALFWVFAFPLMYALFFGSIFGGDGGGARGSMPVALVDDDGSDASAALLERLADSSALGVARDGEGDDAPLVLHTADEARDLVRRGARAAYIRVLPGYGESPWGAFGAGEALIEVGIDPSRQAEAGMLQGVMMESVFGGMSDRFTDREWISEQTTAAREGIAEADDLDVVQKLVFTQFMNALDVFFEQIDDELLADGPAGAMSGGGAELVDVVEVTRERGDEPQSTFEITFPTAMIWGLMSVALTFAITIVRERTQGTLLRLQVAPISRASLLAGKALGCFLMCQVVMVFLLLVGTIALGVRIADAGLMVLAMVCIAACFTGLMMIASVMGKTEQAVAGASWGLMMPFAMIGGGMIPLIAMPSWLLALSDFSPFKWGILAMEGAIWRGFTLGDMLAPCGILLALGAAFFACGVWIFRRADR